MANKTIIVCGKCGKTTSIEQATGWLREQRIGSPAGYLIIRCPEHITDYARRQAGQKQQYYHDKKANHANLTIR